MIPNTPSAMASGRMARSAFATYGAFVVVPATGPKAGMTLLTAETTAASCADPLTRWNET